MSEELRKRLEEKAVDVANVLELKDRMLTVDDAYRIAVEFAKEEAKNAECRQH